MAATKQGLVSIGMTGEDIAAIVSPQPQHVATVIAEHIGVGDAMCVAISFEPTGHKVPPVGTKLYALPDGVRVDAPQREARVVPPGKWKVDMPDGTYGRMPGDPPGPASVRAVIDGYVYDVEPRTGRLIASNPPRGVPAPEKRTSLMKQDEQYRQALAIALQAGRASVSLIQRKLSIGYNAAQELVVRMLRDGLIDIDDTPGVPVSMLRTDGVLGTYKDVTGDTQ